MCVCIYIYIEFEISELSTFFLKKIMNQLLCYDLAAGVASGATRAAFFTGE